MFTSELRCVVLALGFLCAFCVFVHIFLNWASLLVICFLGVSCIFSLGCHEFVNTSPVICMERH